MITMIQHPVGQGGLFSGTLDLWDTRFRWVYDCGSVRSDEESRNREIDTISIMGDIDVLYLSHLDDDHVNGIARLLGNCKVKDVVIPHLYDYEFLAFMAMDLRMGDISELSRNYIEMAFDETNWFLERRVERVIRIQRSDSTGPTPLSSEDSGDGGYRGPTDPSEDDTSGVLGPDAGERIQSSWISGDGSDALSRTKRGTVFDARADSCSVMNYQGWNLNWTLVPYVYQPNTKRMKAFKKNLKREFKSVTRKDILEIVKDATEIRRLRDCYSGMWKDHNLVSMSLYCGPIISRGHYELTSGELSEEKCVGGWLLTGDANLSGVRHPKRFFEWYKRYINSVGVFMAPHHGSNRSIGDNVLQHMPNLRTCYAAAGTNGYGHPGIEVKKLSKRNRVNFHEVDTSDDSRLTMKGISEINPCPCCKRYCVRCNIQE